MNIQWFLTYLRDSACDRETAAGYGGHMHDGGAAVLRNQVECYEAGQKGTIPECWKKDYKDFERSQDPEYATYQRLKQKFEGR